MDDDETGYVLTFDTADPQFCRGFEAGLVWAHAYHAGGLNAMVHANNAEMVLRICETLDMPWRVEETSDDRMLHVILGAAISEDDD